MLKTKVTHIQTWRGGEIYTRTLLLFSRFLGALVNKKSNLSTNEVYLDIVKQRRWRVPGGQSSCWKFFYDGRLHTHICTNTLVPVIGLGMLHRFCSEWQQLRSSLAKRKTKQRRTGKSVAVPTSRRTIFSLPAKLSPSTKVLEEVYLKLPSVLVSIDYGFFFNCILPILEISLPLKEKKSLA